MIYIILITVGLNLELVFRVRVGILCTDSTFICVYTYLCVCWNILMCVDEEVVLKGFWCHSLAKIWLNDQTSEYILKGLFDWIKSFSQPICVCILSVCMSVCMSVSYTHTHTYFFWCMRLCLYVAYLRITMLVCI